MRLALVGCGYVANFYRLTLPLHPELELVGVCDEDERRAKRMAALTSSRHFENLDVMLEDQAVELVLNLTNPSSHYEVTRRCLEAGRHVYTEKPIALEIEQARALVALAGDRQLVLSSAPCTLLNESAQTMWRAVRDQIVGQVRLVYAEMDDGMLHRMPVERWVNEAGAPWPYRDEFATGCTVEHAGYVLTWLCAMFGPAESVTAFSTTLVPDKLPDEGMETTAPDLSIACVKFTSGVVARATCGIYAPKDRSLRIYGDEGVLETRDIRHDLSSVMARRYVSIRRRRMLLPWRKKIKMLSPPDRKKNPKGSEQRDFCSGIAEMVAAIREDRACRLNADFCLHVNELTLAAHTALESSGAYRMTTSFDPIDPMPWAR